MPILPATPQPDNFYKAVAAIQGYAGEFPRGRLSDYVQNYVVTVNHVVGLNIQGLDGFRIDLTLAGGNEDRTCYLYVDSNFLLIDTLYPCRCDNDREEVPMIWSPKAIADLNAIATEYHYSPAIIAAFKAGVDQYFKDEPEYVRANRGQDGVLFLSFDIHGNPKTPDPDLSLIHITVQGGQIISVG